MLEYDAQILTKTPYKLGQLFLKNIEFIGDRSFI